MIEEWRINDLERRLDQAEHSAAALKNLVAGFMEMFLSTSPSDTLQPRFIRICEEAEARCRGEDQKKALRSIVAWEGGETGWRQNSLLSALD